MILAGTKALIASGFPKTDNIEQELLVHEYRMIPKPYLYDQLARAVRAVLDGQPA